ncbi:NAD(P)-dependent alcohol dehydrogenase [Kineococcus glutinatus]|uniref:NAD(P)-dependent alcohol dehydrogenase n=1 Tax=Kineococcus glutinatus TaxID=1070872 RepID=A0ABP9HNN8_9ACTN
MQHGYGSADTWEQRDLPVPVPGRGQVLVRVHAAAVDRGTWHLMTGTPLLVRPAVGFGGLRRPVPGRDLAGVVEAVGEDVAGFAPGEEVFGTGEGSLAEFSLVPARRLARKPAALSFEEAAAAPVSGLTALQALRAGGLRAPGDGEGRAVLVIGASGGVGTSAVQLARSSGAAVTGVCGPTKADLVRSLGAEQVLDHTREDVDATGTRYDVVLDIAGNRPVSLLRRALTPAGTLVVVGGEGGGRLTGGLHRQLGAAALSPFVRQRLVVLVASENAADLAELARLADEGAFRPALDRTFPLAEAAKAIRHLEAGHARGKVVVTLRG